MKKTIEQYLRDYLDSYALFPDTVDHIITALKAQPGHVSMAQRWNDSVSDYPTSMLAVLTLSTKTTALDWLKANQPAHFAIRILEA